MERITLEKNIKLINDRWNQLDHLVVASYDQIMTNEDFWDCDGHKTFRKITGWHQLGHA